MARYLFSQGCFLSAIYCGGYSGEDPPLPIPNREVKLTIADGTAPPGGRVGSCRSSGLRSTHVDRSLFLCPIVQSLTPKGKVVRKLTLRTTSPFGCTSPAHPGLHRRWPKGPVARTECNVLLLIRWRPEISLPKSKQKGGCWKCRTDSVNLKC